MKLPKLRVPKADFNVKPRHPSGAHLYKRPAWWRVPSRVRWLRLFGRARHFYYDPKAGVNLAEAHRNRRELKRAIKGIAGG